MIPPYRLIIKDNGNRRNNGATLAHGPPSKSHQGSNGDGPAVW